MERLGGLINFLFCPGASGTFIANSIAHTMINPWHDAYIPEYNDEKFEFINEYINPWMHMTGVWHPAILEDALPALSNTKWIVIDITQEEFYFSTVINTVKYFQKAGFEIDSAMNHIKNEINMDVEKRYSEYKNQITKQINELQKQNQVKLISYEDMFSNSTADAIGDIFNLLYSGHDSLCHARCQLIADNCQDKHDRDQQLFNTITKDNGKSILEQLVTAAPYFIPFN